MERRTSLGGHLSLSASNIASPLAESTQINGSSLQSKFPWGGKMSPASGAVTKNGVSSAQKSTPKAVLSPIRKIDPRVYTDVQSNGLTSRIVKYHENSSKLNRSMSVGNLYNKPGQFPVVHLKRAEVHMKPKQNASISVVRIAPPDKSLYQASARSSILRSGSIIPTIGLEKPNEKESRDNRPILPPAENDVNPTRSVLDALKEISRKRINSDDVDCSDSIKKYCKESDEEPRRKLHLPLTHLATQSQQVSVITKRQREIPSPTESKTNSPELIDAATKKRLCTKNNDISSSLSSSILINTPKRKLQDVQGRPPIGRQSPSSSSLAPPRAKQHCNDRNYVVADDSELENAFKYPPDQLTPIPLTPACDLVPGKSQIDEEKPKLAPQKPKLTLFDKDYDTAQVIQKDNNEARQPEEEGIAGISFIKPKKNSPVFTGKNALIERVQTSKLSLMLSCLSGELNDSDDEVDSKSKDKSRDAAPLNEHQKETSLTPPVSSAASFTIPATEASKTTSSVPVTSAPAINSEAASTPPTTSAPSFSFGLKSSDKTTSASSTASSVSVINSTAPVKPMLSFGNTINTSKASDAVNSATPVSAASGANFISSPAKLTFGVEQQNTSSLSDTAASNTASTTTTSVIAAPEKGFSFDQQKLSGSGTVSITNAPSYIPQPANSALSNTPLFAFGAAKPQNASLNPAATTTAVVSAPAPPSYSATSTAMSFSNPAPSFRTLVSSQSQAKPVFSFGASATNANSSMTTMSSAAPAFTLGSTASKPLAMFGSNTANTTSANLTASANQQPGIVSFASANQPQTAPVFGSIGSAFTSAGSAVKSPPKFVEASNTFGVAATAPSNPGGFSFGGVVQSGNTIGQGLFGPGANAAVTTAAANPAPFTFGTATANKAIDTPPSFNFAASTANNNSAISAFGAATTTAAAVQMTQTPFAFGQSAGGANQPASTQPSQFSFQGAAQNNQTGAPGFNFGANAASNSSPFGLGSAPNNVSQTQTTKAFPFGGSNPPSAFTSISGAKPAAGGFAFNASSTANTENKGVFGSNGVQPTNQFSFSASSVNKPPDQPRATQTFGSQAAPSSNTFGAPAMTPGKLFSFGAIPASNNAPAGANQNTNLFGTPATNNSSAPLFPAASNIAASPFGAKPSAAKAAAPVFNFGNSTASATNNAPNTVGGGGGAFTFGADTAQQQNTNKPFSFGASAAPPSGNIFGSKTLAFQFAGNAAIDAGDGGNNNNPLAPAGNPFTPMEAAPGPDFLSMQRRDIRTATRRLKPK